ncbi:Hypothetical predicted protein [Podarcis lilfordi]|uniref:Uncharacterized protein n=1 Tax=Podarcis lilfordi TaxID=74358 RepID=A0AA35KTR9_9SAUR|nr:Hypothetical predicted protein [Podarcis lilfordi]
MSLISQMLSTGNNIMGSFHVLTELWSGTEEGFAKSLKQHSLKSLWEPAEALDRLKITGADHGTRN